MSRHANIAIFVPHEGCPCRCSFCDQHSISSTTAAPTPQEVRALLLTALDQMGRRAQTAQVAFFGGSFTAIDERYRLSLLEAAAPFTGTQGFSGIRISTRPDCIDGKILGQLVSHGVTAVELGAQSMDDGVLAANRRGHTAGDTRSAAQMVKAKGLELGLQMMTGLWQGSVQKDLDTAHQIAALRPDVVRIYPTLVLKGTLLEQLYRSGQYKPLSLEEAVELCADLLEYFNQQHIRVIRLGLHDMPSLDRSVVAGPRHPAFRELCEGRILLDSVLEQLQEQQLPGGIILRVRPGDISKMAGHKRCNLLHLSQMGFAAKIIEDQQVPYLRVAVEAAHPFQRIS